MLAAVGSIADLMTQDVVTVAPEDTLGEAAAKMTEKGIGAVVVSDFGRMIGILSERDIMRAVADRIHSSEARVREWMTADPVTATRDTTVEEAGRTMLENGFRHLPVVDGERAIGMLSIRDVAQYGLQVS
jgi:CBS domain-containing protein